MQDFADSIQKDFVVGGFKKTRAHQQNKTMDMPDLKMVVSEEESSFRFKDRGKKNRYTCDLHA